MSFLTIMGITTVMMKTTMKPAFLMEEIAVDQMSIHNTAQNANALEEEGAVEELQHLQEEILVIMVGLLMGIVMISTII